VNRIRFGWALAAALMGLASSAASAQAYSLGKAGDIRYAGGAEDLDADDSAQTTADCPVGSSVLGGGFNSSVGDADVTFSSSYPNDDGDEGAKPDDGWNVTASNSGGDLNGALFATAVCLKSDKAPSYPRTIGTFNTAVNFSRTECADDRTVSGGGVLMTGGLLTHGPPVLNTTAPTDNDSDSDGRPDNAWENYVAVENDSVTANAFAICQRRDLVYRSETSSAVQAGGYAIAVASCPKKTAVAGGGAFASGSSTDGNIVFSDVYDDSDNNEVPEDGWQALFRNASGTEKSITVYASCMPI
jgi:hypothetical protein